MLPDGVKQYDKSRSNFVTRATVGPFSAVSEMILSSKYSCSAFFIYASTCFKCLIVSNSDNFGKY